MGYLVIKGEETHYNVTLQPFVTQHGYRAFRFIGDTIPVTDKGFLFYADSGALISDLSDFTHYYAPNEYSMEADEMAMPKGSDAPVGPSPLDNLNKKVNRLSNQVNQITPFEETKTGYYGENEKVFYNVPEGNVSIFFDNYTGDYSIDRIGDRLTVKFPERLTDTTTITLTISK